MDAFMKVINCPLKGRIRIRYTDGLIRFSIKGTLDLHTYLHRLYLIRINSEIS